MRYDIFIIDDEITFNNFNEVAQNSIKNAKVTFFSQIEDLINEIEFTDILVLNIDSINLFNKNKRACEHVFTGDIGNLTDENIKEKMSLTESYKEIVTAVELLNETYRDVMYYHFVCDMKIKDIADLLGEKPSAVQQKLIRGKKKLLEILDDDLRD